MAQCLTTLVNTELLLKDLRPAITSKYPLWPPNKNSFLFLAYDQYTAIEKSPSSRYVWIPPSVTKDDRINSVSSLMIRMNHKGCWTCKKKCTGRFETTWLEGRRSLWVIAGLFRSGKWRRDESWRYPGQWGCKKMARGRDPLSFLQE
jgi:hypothetical protein